MGPTQFFGFFTGLGCYLNGLILIWVHSSCELWFSEKGILSNGFPVYGVCFILGNNSYQRGLFHHIPKSSKWQQKICVPWISGFIPKLSSLPYSTTQKHGSEMACFLAYHIWCMSNLSKLNACQPMSMQSADGFLFCQLP